LTAKQVLHQWVLCHAGENFSAIGSQHAWWRTHVVENPHGGEPAWWKTRLVENPLGGESAWQSITNQLTTH